MSSCYLSPFPSFIDIWECGRNIDIWECGRKEERRRLKETAFLCIFVAFLISSFKKNKIMINKWIRARLSMLSFPLSLVHWYLRMRKERGGKKTKEPAFLWICVAVLICFKENKIIINKWVRTWLFMLSSHSLYSSISKSTEGKRKEEDLGTSFSLCLCGFSIFCFPLPFVHNF